MYGGSMAGNNNRTPPPVPKAPLPQVHSTAPKVMSCVSCGAPVTLRTLGQAISAVCGSCGSVIDVNNGLFKLIQAADAKRRAAPPRHLELGQRGKIDGLLLEVVGFMERGVDDVTWGEYLLFNPYRGFRWLVEADGHWTFVTPIKDLPRVTHKENRLTYKGEAYRIFSRDEATVRYVVGEFYWRVKAGEKVLVCDYVCPPKIMSSEKSADELNWSHGVYIEPAVLTAAFAPKTPLPAQKGIAPCQPRPVTKNLGRNWLTAFAILTVLQLTHCFRAADKAVWKETLKLTGEATSTVSAASGEMTQTFVSPAFKLNGRDNIEIAIDGDLDNAWLQYDGVLFNETTQEQLGFTDQVSYYHGSSDGESWSEGSHTATTHFNRVPAGAYHLVLDVVGAASETERKPIAFKAEVRNDVTIVSNYFLALTAITLPAAMAWRRRLTFEARRWANSDFSTKSD